MRDIKTRIKKLEDKPVNNRSYVIFVTHGEYNGEQVYLISAGKENFICRTKESAIDLLERIVKNNEVVHLQYFSLLQLLLTIKK